MADSAKPITTLAIETSNPSVGAGDVCVGVQHVDGRRQTLAVQSLTPKSRHDDALMPAINAAMRIAGLQPRDLDRIAVSIGPGGFTGLRVAVTTAKIIAEVAGAECVQAPTALIAAAVCFESDASIDCAAVALSSKRESAWVALVKRGASVVEQCDAAQHGQVLDAAGLTAALSADSCVALLADAHLPESLARAASSCGAQIVSPRLSAEMCLALSWELPATEILRCSPLYPREPEAVSKWRALHS